MSIIQDSSFNIPLYHGTTGVFIDSIKQHGLGAVDPLEGLKAKALMQNLFDIAERQNWNDTDWLGYRTKLEPLLLQSKNELYNFKHGSSYLTYSFELAKRYAVENPFGCEYLQYIRVLLAMLVNRNVPDIREYIDHPVLKVWERPNDPYVIKLKGIKLSEVEAEIDADLDQQIFEIEKMIAKCQFDARSFKLTQVIPPEKLGIIQIGSWNSTGTELLEK
jgi:hypothetical protein